MTCIDCNGTRQVVTPARKGVFMGREFDISAKTVACGRCSTYDAVAMRTACYPGAPGKIVRARLELSHDGRWVRMTEGNVTGYESFEMTRDVSKWCREKGWLACAGTRGRWDSLEISAEEMRRALDFFGLKE